MRPACPIRIHFGKPGCGEPGLQLIRGGRRASMPRLTRLPGKALAQSGARASLSTRNCKRRGVKVEIRTPKNTRGTFSKIQTEFVNSRGDDQGDDDQMPHVHGERLPPGQSRQEPSVPARHALAGLRQQQHPREALEEERRGQRRELGVPAHPRRRQPNAQPSRAKTASPFLPRSPAALRRRRMPPRAKAGKSEPVV